MDNLNAAIDAEVFSFFKEWPRQMKMAMLLVSVEEKLFSKDIDVSLDDIANRIYALVDEGRLIGFGDIRNWRHSEIYLSDDGSVPGDIG